VRGTDGSLVRLSIAIQHHPSRAHLLEGFANLGSLDVVTDPDPDNRIPNPWRTYRRCLETTPDWATHRLVLQDDVECCPGFLSAALSATEAQPNRMVAFFVPVTLRRGGRALMAACAADEAWAEMLVDEWVPVCALSWPVAVIPEFMEWADGRGYSEHKHRADDAIVGLFCRHRGVPVIATVPSLVEHPDRAVSLVGNAVGSRRARCYVGTEAHLIDW
jgi:hypothetical protein